MSLSHSATKEHYKLRQCWIHKMSVYTHNLEVFLTLSFVHILKYNEMILNVNCNAIVQSASRTLPLYL